MIRKIQVTVVIGLIFLQNECIISENVVARICTAELDLRQETGSHVYI